MEETLRKGIEKGREIVTHGRTDSHKLQPGDHIFVMRYLHTYTHHGIYVGDEYVIHFLETEKRNSIPHHPCRRCGYRKNVDLGVVKTCLDCFINAYNPFNGHTLHLFQYGVSSIEHTFRRRGTCSTLPSKPPQQAVKTATEHLKTGFGNYDLLVNNCENFATFCKTGVPSSSEQVKRFATAAVLGAATVGAAVSATAAVVTIGDYFEKRKAQNGSKSVGYLEKEGKE